jgi:hypothetical protein
MVAETAGKGNVRGDRYEKRETLVLPSEPSEVLIAVEAGKMSGP